MILCDIPGLFVENAAVIAVQKISGDFNEQARLKTGTPQAMNCRQQGIPFGHYSNWIPSGNWVKGTSPFAVTRNVFSMPTTPFPGKISLGSMATTMFS